MPNWIQEFLPIAGLLVVVAFVIGRLPKVEVGHSPAFRKRRVFNWLPLGLTYAFLYMGRYNINVAKVALNPATGDPWMTKAQLGVITVFGTTTYALAFLINGPLTDRYGGRRMIMTAALGAAAANLGMGYVMRSDSESVVSSFKWLYALNMYFQAFGAVAIVKVNAHWFHVRERGVFGGIFGILISLGLYFAYDWGTPIANNYATEWVFFLPALILLGFAVLDYLLVFDNPSDVGHRDFDPGDGQVEGDDERVGVLTLALRMVRHPVILTIILPFCHPACACLCAAWPPSPLQHPGFLQFCVFLFFRT